MAQWHFDAEDGTCGLWIIGTEWSYDPDTAEFEKSNAVVPLDQVPLPLRQLLETEAQRLTNMVLGAGQQQALGPQVDIDHMFVDDEITDCVVLGSETFGSEGAASCLIAFATGTNAQGQHVAVGGHLVDQAYDPRTVNKMLQKLGKVTGSVSFDIFGGEVGRNTVVNPPQDITMDYSRYYPFIHEIGSRAAQGGVTIRRYNFPSNGPTQNTGAAINQGGVVAVFHG